MPQKCRLAVPTLREPEAVGNTLNVDVNQQVLGELSGGNSLPNVLLRETCTDGNLGEE